MAIPLNCFTARCQFGENCQREVCFFAHRFIDLRCKFAENCRYGEKCKFKHITPEEAYQNNITDKINKQHPDQCRFGWNCTKEDCVYSHTTAEMCGFFDVPLIEEEQRLPYNISFPPLSNDDPKEIKKKFSELVKTTLEFYKHTDQCDLKILPQIEALHIALSEEEKEAVEMNKIVEEKIKTGEISL